MNWAEYPGHLVTSLDFSSSSTSFVVVKLHLVLGKYNEILKNQFCAVNYLKFDNDLRL